VKNADIKLSYKFRGVISNEFKNHFGDFHWHSICRKLSCEKGNDFCNRLCL